MSKNKPLVSVVMPTFNGSTSGYIKESIESVLRQTYKNFEFIIVNDCSIDDTLNIIQDYASQDDRIRIVNNQTNQKLPQSLNNGFNLANGIYYTWTSDDNYYHENALEEMVKYLEKNPNSLSMTAKKGEIDNKTNELLYKFLPRYIEKYPNLNLDVISRMRMALVSGLNLKDEVKKIWKTSDRRTKRMIYVFLRDRFANSGKNIYKESIKVLSVKYIIKFYIFCIKHRIKF
ncbi:TPA: glycosyltransferase family 2 protein [Campylobacter coli]